MRTFPLAALLAIGILSSFSVFAGGLLGDGINVIAPGVGTALDNANRNAKEAVPAYKNLDEGVSAAGRHVGSEIMAQVGGVPLEQWIIASHNSAVNGSIPIPPQIRQALTGYASEYSLSHVRFKVGDNGFFNLANALEKGGFASAVTLIDVVVFRGPSEANDLSIWAHELTHVDQYHDWGVHSFAVQYSRDFNSVERPAYAKGNGYWAWAQNRGAPGPVVVSNPPAAGMGHLCVVRPPNGPFSVRDMGQLYPLGSRCANNPFWGTVQ